MGRSMSSAAIRTRVATRPGSAVGVAVGGGADPSGGRVSRGVAVGLPVLSMVGEGVTPGSAATGVV